jgi:hypothetical protein
MLRLRKGHLSSFRPAAGDLIQYLFLHLLKEIATNGHNNGITFFGWWQNIAPLTRQFGYEWNRQMLGRIVLKTEASTIREVLGSGYFGLRTISARALFLDASGDASAEFLIPYSAMSEE